MCGRYVSPNESAIEREFNLVHSEWKFPERYNVPPTTDVPAIWHNGAATSLTRLRWGLVPFFAKGVAGKYSTFNARIETLTNSASYRGPWKRAQRCIIPAHGFYEWQVNEDGSKQPYYIHLTDQEIFGFAGLWDRSSDASGAHTIESCTIITLPANALMAKIHNVKARMPALLTRESRDVWLCGGLDEAAAVLTQYPDALMAATKVSARVNSPRNNDKKLLDAVNS